MSYTVNGATYNYDSSINQRIKDKLVEREVYACVSDMVGDLMRAEVEGWGYEEFENTFYYACPDCESSNVREATEDDISTILESFDGDYEADDIDVSEFYICEMCQKAILVEDLEGEFFEPLEFWIVSSMFGKDLKRRGEVVMERYGGWIWGRQATGQAISLDEIINEIAKDMEILDGQKYSWANSL